MNQSQQTQEKTLTVSLDAEKAIDKVSWTVFFNARRKFGFRVVLSLGQDSSHSSLFTQEAGEDARHWTSRCSDTTK